MMEARKDLASLLPFLPVVLRSASLSWPLEVEEALRSLTKGPNYSCVDSGEAFFLFISNIRKSLACSSETLAASAGDGYVLFFDQLMSPYHGKNWFCQILPVLGDLILRLPSLLETHYHEADHLSSDKNGGIKIGLRLLDSQQSGIVFLRQELISALLASSLFCLFPNIKRTYKRLPLINFDKLFALLYDRSEKKDENRVLCIIHYFQRICARMPVGFVSFERKVNPGKDGFVGVSYPVVDIWGKSVAFLCPIKVFKSGKIEDHDLEALLVDFANPSFGGGVLSRGCVQISRDGILSISTSSFCIHRGFLSSILLGIFLKEEILFVIKPELIVGMLFLPLMDDNEAIEVVGAERFSKYTGYASSFRFSGDYMDSRDVDSFGRRRTRIVAIDALHNAGNRQYKLECLIREINKAFCGFYDQSKYQQYQNLFRKGAEGDLNIEDCMSRGEDDIGVATGNWGCGVFKGDPEIKAIIQWLAASQALRPSMTYYTFGLEAVQNLEQVCEWIVSHEWRVGEVWSLLLEYSSQRRRGQTNIGFFAWLLPQVCGCAS